MTDELQSLRSRIGAYQSWANTTDRAARTEHARQALAQKFLDEANGDPLRAEALRKAHYLRLALKSAQSRRRAREAISTAEAAERELAELGEEAG